MFAGKKSLAETKVSGQMFLRKININRHDAFETLLIVYLSSAYPNFPQTSPKLLSNFRYRKNNAELDPPPFERIKICIGRLAWHETYLKLAFSVTKR